MAKKKLITQSSDLNYHKIGETIRKYRKEKRLKLIELAAKTKISSAMLSKIENGRMIPTIPTLFCIIYQLNIQADAFFSELSKESHFQGYFFIPESDYEPYVKEEKAVGFSYLSIFDHTVNAGTFQVSMVHLAPGAKRSQITTEAYEYLYVLKGSLTYQLGKESFKMNSGDSLFFDGKIPHVPINESDKVATMLVVYFYTDKHS